jgi:hypothetical protein
MTGAAGTSGDGARGVLPALIACSASALVVVLAALPPTLDDDDRPLPGEVRVERTAGSGRCA